MTAKGSRRPSERASPPPSHHSVTNWHDEVDRLFDGFFPAAFGRALQGRDPWLGRPFRSFGEHVPSVDVKEHADRYEIAAELPGLDAKDVELTIKDGVLSIKGEKRSEHSEEAGNVRVSERGFGSFERSFRLPGNADADAIGAEFAKGVLTVTVPKQDDAVEHQRKIEIKPH